MRVAFFLIVAQGSFQDCPIKQGSSTNDSIFSATVADNLLALLALMAVMSGLLVCGNLIRMIKMRVEQRRRRKGGRK
jgi:hypothetical protein